MHNSLRRHLTPAFHESRRRLLEKWPDVRPLHAPVGRLDDMEVQPLPVTWFDERNELVERLALATDRADMLDAKLDATEADLQDQRQHIQGIESTVVWRARGRVNRLLRRG